MSDSPSDTAPLPLAAEESALIESFLDVLWLEYGLSINTRAAYRNDLHGYARWLAQHQCGLLRCERAQVMDYLEMLKQQDRQPRSRARAGPHPSPPQDVRASAHEW